MKLTIKRKGLMKIGLLSSIIFILVFLGFLFSNLFQVSADVNPGSLEGYNFCGGFPCPSFVNLSKSDMFFANGNTVFVIINISCSPGNVCNTSTTADANFSQIGGNQVRRGLWQNNASDGSWVIFEFNSTINLSNINQVQPKNVTFNATVLNETSGLYESYDLPNFIATVVMFNMSTFGCPPPDEPNAQFPQVPGFNITSGQPVLIPVQAVGCTQNTTLCSYVDTYGPGTWNGTNWLACAPNFGGATTNLTAIAESGNMSRIANFTIEVLNKAKIVFNTNVSFASQQEAQAVMQFAMGTLMSGGKIGLDASQWNGTNNKPNFNLSATLTIYNISQYFSISGRPQIFRYPQHMSNANGQMCPASICSGFIWDGANLTFNVGSFSDYGLNDSINVTLNLPSNNGHTKLITNFTFTPEWSAGVAMKNCTLYTNITGTWQVNTTNQTPLVNNVINGINISLATKSYIWNIYCYDTTDQYDYATNNYTVIVDTVSPLLNTTLPVHSSYIRGTSSQLFQINVFDDSLNTSNATLFYRQFGAGSYSTSALACYGTAPSFVCNNSVDISGLSETVVEFYFEASDNATNIGNNGTSSSPMTATIDRTAPTYANYETNQTNSTTLSGRPIIGIFAYWSDNNGLGSCLLSHNGTGTWVNNSCSLSAQNNAWSNVSITTSTISNYFQAKIFINDSAGNQNVTTIFGWTIDSVQPQFLVNNTNDTDNIIGRYDSIVLFANWTDNVDLDKAILETNESGIVENKTSIDINLTAGQTWSNFTWSNSSVAVGTVIQWRIFANDTSGNTNVTSNNTFTIDNTTPQFGNASVSQTSPTEYSPGKTYIFNISWSDTVPISKVIFEANFTGLTNYTADSLGNNNYSITFTGLPANSTSNYTYKWYANDTSNIWNSTSYYIYNITKNQTNQINLYFNDNLNQNLTITYPTQINATALGVYTNSGTLTMFRNETNKTSENGSNITLVNGTYVYKVNITGNANYTDNSTGLTLYLFVNKGTTILNLTASPAWTIIYGNNVSISCNTSSVNNEVTVELYSNYANGTVVNITENNTRNITASIGSWIFICNSSSTSNYTSNSTSRNLTVTSCGDGTCNYGESCSSCSNDCGSCSSDGGSSSGGGGGSSNASSQIKVNVTIGNANITIPSIAAGKIANVTINKTDDMAIRRIEITVTNSVNNIKIVITKLAGQPASIIHEISGNVYHYIEINKTNIDDNRINKTKIQFTVKKSWINQNNINQSTIALYRYSNNNWNSLTTNKISEDSEEIYFESESPGLSYFAISAEQIVSAPEPTVCPTCPTTTSWSDCINSKQTRTAYRCSEQTNYQCEPYIEEQACQMLPTPSTEQKSNKLMISVIIIVIIAIVALFLLYIKKKRIKSYQNITNTTNFGTNQ